MGADPTLRFRRAGGLARRRVADEVVVLDPRRQWIFGFNTAAGQVLEALEQPASAAELAALLASPAEAREELEIFLADLLAEGLVESVESVPDGEVGSRPPVSGEWLAPRKLWREAVLEVTHQASPPQMITNPQCIP